MTGLKQIILVITDSRGVSQAVVTDDLKHILLDEAIRLVRRGILAGVHIVESNGRAYLRSNANSSTGENLDNLASSYSEGLLVPTSRRGKHIADKLKKFSREILE